MLCFLCLLLHFSCLFSICCLVLLFVCLFVVCCLFCCLLSFPLVCLLFVVLFSCLFAVYCFVPRRNNPYAGRATTPKAVILEYSRTLHMPPPIFTIVSQKSIHLHWGRGGTASIHTVTQAPKVHPPALWLVLRAMVTYLPPLPPHTQLEDEERLYKAIMTLGKDKYSSSMW